MRNPWTAPVRALAAGACALACAATVATGPAAAQPGAPGTPLAVEPLPAAAAMPGAARTARLLYRSTTVGEQPATASAAVYFPAGTAPEGGWPVIAWAHGTVGLGDDCAYSVGGPAAVERDRSYLGTWLAQGYAVVAADYAGLGVPGEHPYLNGRVAAHNVVDAVRAAHDRYPELSNRWAVVGQSQGGGAAVFTARYATEFGGPALDYRGAVATGLPAYLEEVFLALGPNVPPVALGTHLTAYVLYVLDGLRQTHPELDVPGLLTEQGRNWLARASTACIEPLAAELRGVAIGDLFAKPLASLPDAHGVLARQFGLPESGYDRPVFVGQGLYDTDVVTPQALRWAAVTAAKGEPIRLHTYFQDHSGTVNASLPDSTPFVRELFGR
ncbi:lipase family protein [Nocardia harenae]|uniref:lipase family protein n=1 Tax=Nocardia harenae TaxID=358707 RepID=UPI00082C2EB7|nr:lipase family protein [Nocardia harenae]